MIKVNVKYDWKNLNPYIKKVTVGDKEGLENVGIYLVEQIRNIFPWSGSGREYWWQGTKIRSSAPGEPPIIRTGRLRASITMNSSWGVKASGSVPHFPSDSVKKPPKPITGNIIVVGSNVPYADDLEWGTWTSIGRSGGMVANKSSLVHIEPRPWLSSAYASALPKIFPIYVSVLKRFLS